MKFRDKSYGYWIKLTSWNFRFFIKYWPQHACYQIYWFFKGAKARAKRDEINRIKAEKRRIAMQERLRKALGL